ncbi:uncharacterized protein MYCFIDRAFT_170181 [Pseudocercospora fijiensis CIRAD86]|uniref:Uncharacterized protein n=1 Tax=Pseudocercospora fijiensis (strain CIRAD86) TaxID=383855 RepID=N1Q9Y3_PSEFD|nr:uncharacterized protein MYCFIDRAFT_170181 [Pseudocercospora fijiensis CIRAD86]EME88596.1 hypothetical protein MYCFIDRAFT_170181 [Pseudocercospora fijiensis CIRAD86]
MGSAVVEHKVVIGSLTPPELRLRLPRLPTSFYTKVNHVSTSSDDCYVTIHEHELNGTIEPQTLAPEAPLPRYLCLLYHTIHSAQGDVEHTHDPGCEHCKCSYGLMRSLMHSLDQDVLETRLTSLGEHLCCGIFSRPVHTCMCTSQRKNNIALIHENGLSTLTNLNDED